jgi:hypothetical protein
MTAPRNPDDDLERLLDDDGGELGALYRRLPRMEPARRLDRSVLGEAARAMHGRPPRKQRWMVGLGSAAGLVLAAGVAWHVGQDALHQPAPSPTYTTPAYVPVQPIEESGRRRHEAAAAPATDALSTQSAPSDAAPAAPPQAAQREAKSPAPKVAKQMQPGAPAASAPRPTPMPAPAVPVPPPAQNALAADADKARSADTQSSPAAGAAAAQRADQSEPESASRAQADLSAAHERFHGSVAPTTSVELRRDMQLAPEDWLAHIEQLLHQGRRQQALESLQLFRRMHPDWKISRELRALGD